MILVGLYGSIASILLGYASMHCAPQVDVDLHELVECVASQKVSWAGILFCILAITELIKGSAEAADRPSSSNGSASGTSSTATGRKHSAAGTETYDMFERLQKQKADLLASCKAAYLAKKKAQSVMS